MRIEHTFKEIARKKVMLQNYALGHRIWELEQAFNEAQKQGDYWYSEKYDREIAGLYRKAGINEA